MSTPENANGPNAIRSEHEMNESTNPTGDEESFMPNIKVCLRVRPMNKLETSRRSRNCIEYQSDNQSITIDSPAEGENYDFKFNKVRISTHRIFISRTCSLNLFSIVIGI